MILNIIKFKLRFRNANQFGDFADEANKHQSAFQAISTKAANLRDQKRTNDTRDFAIATNNDYLYKNALVLLIHKNYFDTT